MLTLFYVGKPYPRKDTLAHLRSLGYRLGLFRDPTNPTKLTALFDYVIDLDFSSEDAFKDSLGQQNQLPRIDGLLCTYENYIVFEAIVATTLSLPSLSIEAAHATTDKLDMRECFLAYNPGITPEFAAADSESALLQFADEIGYPLILKPTNLVKSLLVSKCRNQNELLAAYRSSLAELDRLYEKLHITNRVPRLIVERCIEGQMCSIAAFVDAHGTPHFCPGIVELTTAQQIGFNDNFLYARKLSSTIPVTLETRLFETAQDGVKALSMTSSPAHIEIIFNEREIKIVEIGARIGGYRPFLYHQAYNINMIEQEIKIATGQQPVITGTFKQHVAMYELFPPTEGLFVELSNLPKRREYPYFHQVARHSDKVGPAKAGHKASAVIGVASPNIATFTAQCEEVEAIKVVVA